MSEKKLGKKKTAQDRQDELFRSMSIENKLALVDKLRGLAKELQKLNDRTFGFTESLLKNKPLKHLVRYGY